MTYLNELRDAVPITKPQPQPYMPLVQQLQTLFATLPPMQLHRPWSIEELLPRLLGRYRPRPAARQVAQALTQLGWQRTRCWKRSGLGRRYWSPPNKGCRQLHVARAED
jgi:hypothetical protein